MMRSRNTTAKTKTIIYHDHRFQLLRCLNWLFSMLCIILTERGVVLVVTCNNSYTVNTINNNNNNNRNTALAAPSTLSTTHHKKYHLSCFILNERGGASSATAAGNDDDDDNNLTVEKSNTDDLIVSTTTTTTTNNNNSDGNDASIISKKKKNTVTTATNKPLRTLHKLQTMLENEEQGDTVLDVVGTTPSQPITSTSTASEPQSQQLASPATVRNQLASTYPIMQQNQLLQQQLSPPPPLHLPSQLQQQNHEQEYSQQQQQQQQQQSSMYSPYHPSLYSSTSTSNSNFTPPGVQQPYGHPTHPLYPNHQYTAANNHSNKNVHPPISQGQYSATSRFDQHGRKLSNFPPTTTSTTFNQQQHNRDSSWQQLHAFNKNHDIMELVRPTEKINTAASSVTTMTTHQQIDSSSATGSVTSKVSLNPNNNKPTTAMPAILVPGSVKSSSRTNHLSFDSLQKILFSFVGVSILSYCAVSPRTADIVRCNVKFKENLGIAALVTVPPILFYFLVIFDANKNDWNTVISTFYSAFTTGYALSFVLELITTTLLRLAIFCIWEPQAFDLTPDVPLPLLPWTLRENKYRPKRITLFAADFLTSCVASAIVEEYIKLKVMQWTVRLPKNFILNTASVRSSISSNATTTNTTTTKRGHNNKKKKIMMEPISNAYLNEQQQQPEDVTSINTYVTHMVASSLGLKLADSVRRALMYTKPADAHKAFYAVCRGIFPIHELCGILTALQLAKRDVLGIYMPLFKILLPAVFIHGMANFRGKKPVFKWNSSTPWSEMQMSPWNVAGGSTLFQILKKGFAKFMWLSFLGQVVGHCIRNYDMITRQAANRTSTCAAGRAEFSAEIKAAEKGFAKFMWLAIVGRVVGYCIKNYYMISRQSST